MLNVTVHQYQIVPDYVKTHGADLVIPQLRAPMIVIATPLESDGSNLIGGTGILPVIPNRQAGSLSHHRLASSFHSSQ